MNIKEMAEQAGISFGGHPMNPLSVYYSELKNFAALVRQDEAQACAKHYLKIMRDAASEARFKEREACLKILSDYGHSEALIECADLIRQRGRDDRP